MTHPCCAGGRVWIMHHMDNPVTFGSCILGGLKMLIRKAERDDKYRMRRLRKRQSTHKQGKKKTTTNKQTNKKNHNNNNKKDTNKNTSARRLLIAHPEAILFSQKQKSDVSKAIRFYLESLSFSSKCLNLLAVFGTLFVKSVPFWVVILHRTGYLLLLLGRCSREGLFLSNCLN